VLVQIVELRGKMLKEVNEGFLLDSSPGDLAMVNLSFFGGLLLLFCFSEVTLAS
jgi:hypothetical protein